jgi:signal transduction histidine kinase/ActR/RegA family two-component response regulator/PAS domain-containing protein
VADWLFITPRYVFGILHPTTREFAGAPLYFLVAAVIASVTESLRRAERRADERARELQALFDTAPIAIWVAHDPACQRVTGNRFADELVGVPIGTNVSLLAQPDAGALPVRVVKDGREAGPGELPIYVSARTGRPVVNSQFDLAFDDGRTISLAGGAAPVKDVEGRVRGAIATLSDVSAQKRAEELSAADLRTMQAFQEISGRFIRGHDLDATLKELLDLAIEVTGADFGNIQFVNPAAQTLDIRAQRGFDREFLEFFAAHHEDAACGTALLRGERVIVEDVSTDPLFHDPRMQAVMRRARVRAVQSTPLLSLSGELLGILSTHHRRPHRPGDHALRYLDMVARQTADILEYVRGEERRAELLGIAERARGDAERAAERLRRAQRITDVMLGDLPLDDLLHKVLVRVQEALATDAAVLLVGKLEKDGEAVLRVRAVVGVPGAKPCSDAPRQGFAVAVATERRPKIWNDIDSATTSVSVLRRMQWRSLAGVPLLFGEHLVGVLEVASLRPGHFTDEDVNLLQIAGERIALGIERAARQDAERQVRESLEASNRAKDEFLAMLGHELRNPLSAVRNAVATARLDQGRRPRALEIAHRQTDQLGRLIDDLLDIARITQGRIVLRKERVNLAEIIERAVESVRPLVEERSVQLTVARTRAALRVDADAARLEQVFVNLLSNAAKYTDAGGRIDVTIDRQGDEVAVHVRDTGIGIAPEMLPRIWDLFTQGDRTLDRAQGGLGIGLTLARRLVDLHGGKIEAHSEGLGKGAEFMVRLAALPVAAGESLPSAAPQPAPERCARVLLVEDNRDTAESLMMLLELLGHRVRAVYDGVAALDAARTSPPDVMLVDIGLPGMDGYEVARRVRRDPDLDGVVLVALTGYGREEDRQRAMAAGFDYHLVKPVSPDALHGLVARLGGLEAAKPTVH